MSSAGSESSLLHALGSALARAGCVLFSITITAWWLLNRIGRGLVESQNLTDRWSGYWSSFGDALTPAAGVSAALGRTMVLAAAGIFLGLVVGSALGLLMRIRRFRPALGLASLPAMALAIPGVAFYPLARAANSFGLAEAGPVGLRASLGDGLAFVGLWGLLAGLAIAPTVAAEVGRTRAGGLVGPSTALNWSAARSNAAAGPRLALPTTAFVLAIASAEVLSDQPGAFNRLFEDLNRRSLEDAFQVVFWLAVAAAVFAAVVEIATSFLDDAQPVGQEPPIETNTARSLLTPAVVLLAFLGAIALAGYLANQPARNAEAVLLGPSLGGPWLGTDSLGRGLAHLGSAGLWPALVAGVVPAVIATLFGTLVAVVITSAPRPVARGIDIATDVLSWPAPVMVPLAFLALGQGQRWGLSSRFLLFTALTLTPLAARLIARTALVERDRFVAQLCSAFLFCTSVAISIHVMIGLAGFGGGNERPQLGTAMRVGLTTYDSSIWPYVVPAAAATLLVGVFYTLSASLTAPTAVQPVPTAVQPTPKAVQPASPVSASQDQSTDLPIPPTAPEPTSVPPPKPEPVPKPEPTPAIAQPQETKSAPVSEPAQPVKATAEEPAAEEPALERSGIENLASRTIELRPSKLRAAGIVAPSEAAELTPLTDKWPKPTLAARPIPATPDPSPDSEQPDEPDQPNPPADEPSE